MLEGITVLNQTEIYEDIKLLVTIFMIIAGIAASGVAFKTANIFAAFGTFLFVLIGACLIFQPIEPTGRYRYECTIDESVSMTEVYERYEIIEQRGDIWVLEDKE